MKILIYMVQMQYHPSWCHATSILQSKGNPCWFIVSSYGDMSDIRWHERHTAADKFRSTEQGGHMALRRPHRFQGNVLCNIQYNGSLASHLFTATATVAVFDSGSLATFLPDSLHCSALRVTTPVETSSIKNVTSHADSRQIAHDHTLNKPIWQ